MGSRQSDYTRICVECSFHEKEGKFHMCSVSRNLVTGDIVKLMCATNRAANGTCGMDGRLYSPANVVKLPERSEGEVAARAGGRNRK